MFTVQSPAAAAAAAGLGGHASIPVSPAAQSRMHLRALTRQGLYVELRARAVDGGKWRKAFFESPEGAAELAQRAKDLADVYVGVLPRTHATYGSDPLPDHGNVIWCEADTEAATARVLNFEPAAPLIVRSSPGKVHAYWFLTQAIPLNYIEIANRRLVHHLGADPKATNSGRILRVAGTTNHKPTGGAVVITRLETYNNISAAALVGHLPDPTPARPMARPTRPALPPDADTDHLRDIPARVYIPRLAGREVYHGFCQCPFHKGGQERTPSLSVGGPNDELWLCFGCDEGGDVFTFAARLWGMDERTQFRDIKSKLKELL